MRVPGLLALAFGLAVPTLSAQTQEFGLWPGSSCSTSRSGLSTSAGDVLTLVDAQDLRGVGQTGDASGVTVGRINGFSVTLQDQDGSTAESFSFAVLPEDSSVPGSPDTNPTNELLRAGPFTLPPTSGTVAWVITATLSTPADVLPAANTFFFGTELGAAPMWPIDGASVFMATYPPLAGCGDNPRVSGPNPAPNVTFAVTRPAGMVSQPSPARTHEQLLLTEGSVLNSGQDVAPAFQTGPNPGFGVGGLYPDTSTTAGRHDGVALRYRAPGFGAISILASAGWGPGFEFSFAAGDLLLDPASTISMCCFIYIKGDRVVPLAKPGTLNAAIGRIHWQAVGLAAALRCSNGTVTDFN